MSVKTQYHFCSSGLLQPRKMHVTEEIGTDFE